MRFEKVSYKQFAKDIDGDLPEGVIKTLWNDIKLPRRATQNSAGYDFFAPFSFELPAEQSIMIPTGIKCQLEDSLFLGILPRSSYGIKYGISLANTMGVIDADYYNNTNNEGHIFIKLVNNGDTLRVRAGEAICQGIIQCYYKTEDDTATDTRQGGIGSTTYSLE